MLSQTQLFKMTKENREKLYKHFRDLEKNYEAREGLNSGPTATQRVRAKSKESADAILKGPIGLSHEESKNIPVDKQPERGALLPMRRRYNTYANFRPVSLPSGGSA